MQKAYLEDLAYIHDTSYGDFARLAAPNIISILKNSDIKDGLVVDLGCGSGILGRALMDAGYDVFGVDISAAMIKIAKSRIPKAAFRVQSFLDTEFPECCAVISIGECLGYCIDSDNNKRNLAKLYGRIFKALQPKGLFIFDLLEPGQIAEPYAETNHNQGDDWAVLVTKSEDRTKKILTRQITTFRKIGKLYRRGQETHRVRLYKSNEIAIALRNTGFSARIVRGYGKLRFGRAHVGFIARKPFSS